MRGSLAIQTRRHFLSNFYFTSVEWMTVDEKNSMGGFSFHSWGVLDTEHFSVKMSALLSWLVNRSVFLFFSVPFSVASPSRLRCDTVGQLLTEPIFSLLSGLILQASKNCTKNPKRHRLHFMEKLYPLVDFTEARTVHECQAMLCTYKFTRQRAFFIQLSQATERDQINR